MIKLLILDLDNCILDNSTISAEVTLPLKQKVRESDLDEKTKENFLYGFSFHNLEYLLGKFQIEKNLAEELRRIYRNLTVNPEIKVFPDFDFLKEIDLPKVLVTSGYTKFQNSKLDFLGIRKFFDQIEIDSIDDPKRIKGKEKIFKEILEKFNFKPEEVLVIGDNPNSELIAGKNLGMKTAQSLRPKVKKEKGFNFYFYSFDEFVKIL